MNFKKLESGRSMVEMLGVLAIIGVLSVGGIAGYSLSMRRHRANGVADYVSKFALVSYSKCQKALLDGISPSYNLCGEKLIPESCNFEAAGIGPLPSGVSDLACPHFRQDESGGDTIIISAIFDDDKLCQAVGSITGTGCVSKTSTTFIIKQN